MILDERILLSLPLRTIVPRTSVLSVDQTHCCGACMLRKVLRLSANPRALLKSVLALDDSPHAIALGIAIGVFVGLTPTVGIQTGLIIAVVFLTRRFFYFNASAAMAATYVSNPFTMLPMYYFWYRLGTWFVPGSMSFDELSLALEFDGVSGWWSSVCALGLEVGAPMMIGALLTAPIGVLIAYPAAFFLVKWTRRQTETEPLQTDQPSDERVDEAHASGMKQDSSSPPRTSSRPERIQNL